jgi:hypothetical protein
MMARIEHKITRDHPKSQPMEEAEIKQLLDVRVSCARVKQLLIDLVKVPSPQTELLEDEPLLKQFIAKASHVCLRWASRISAVMRWAT